MIHTLRALCYYRPKLSERISKAAKTAGHFDINDIGNDLISVRHRELIQDKKDKFVTVPMHIAKFTFQNLKQGILKEMFTDYDAEADSKLKIDLY